MHDFAVIGPMDRNVRLLIHHFIFLRQLAAPQWHRDRRESTADTCSGKPGAVHSLVHKPCNENGNEAGRGFLQDSKELDFGDKWSKRRTSCRIDAPVRRCLGSRAQLGGAERCDSWYQRR